MLGDLSSKQQEVEKVKRQISAALTVAFLSFLAINAKPQQTIEIQPALRAGASVFPVVDWRKTEVSAKVSEQQQAATADFFMQTTDESDLEHEEVVDEPVDETMEQESEIESMHYPDEIDLLCRTVQAEGLTMGVTGMRYITDSILNLARDRGCSIYDVLVSGAYTVVNTGAIWKQSIYSETIEAVNAELNGQLDYEIKYFRTGHYHGFGTPSFNFGNVYFSK